MENQASLDIRILRFRNDQTSETPIALAEALDQEGRHVDARLVLELAERRNLIPARTASLGRAHSFLRQGSWLAARDALISFLEHQPQDVDARVLLADVLLREGRFERATELLESLPEEARERLDVRALWNEAESVSRISQVSLDSWNTNEVSLAAFPLETNLEPTAIANSPVVETQTSNLEELWTQSQPNETHDRITVLNVEQSAIPVDGTLLRDMPQTTPNEEFYHLESLEAVTSFVYEGEAESSLATELLPSEERRIEEPAQEAVVIAETTSIEALDEPFAADEISAEETTVAEEAAVAKETTVAEVAAVAKETTVAEEAAVAEETMNAEATLSPTENNLVDEDAQIEALMAAGPLFPEIETSLAEAPLVASPTTPQVSKEEDRLRHQSTWPLWTRDAVSDSMPPAANVQAQISELDSLLPADANRTARVRPLLSPLPAAPETVDSQSPLRPLSLVAASLRPRGRDLLTERSKVARKAVMVALASAALGIGTAEVVHLSRTGFFQAKTSTQTATRAPNAREATKSTRNANLPAPGAIAATGSIGASTAARNSFAESVETIELRAANLFETGAWTELQTLLGSQPSTVAASVREQYRDTVASLRELTDGTAPVAEVLANFQTNNYWTRTLRAHVRTSLSIAFHGETARTEANARRADLVRRTTEVPDEIRAAINTVLASTATRDQAAPGTLSNATAQRWLEIDEALNARNGTTALALLEQVQTHDTAWKIRHAEALYFADHVEEAAEEVEHMLRDNEGGARAAILRAETLLHGPRTRYAAQLLERAKLELTEDADVRDVLRFNYVSGKFAAFTRKFEEARSYLQNTIESPFAPQDAWFFLAESTISVNHEQSTAHYQEYLRIAPRGYYAERARVALSR